MYVRPVDIDEPTDIEMGVDCLALETAVYWWDLSAEKPIDVTHGTIGMYTCALKLEPRLRPGEPVVEVALPSANVMHTT